LKRRAAVVAVPAEASGHQVTRSGNREVKLRALQLLRDFDQQGEIARWNLELP
jgi:hypothetical protein